ncbi:MAG: D-alanyl-D-alanine carboxypeptidase/D-alanyl-D-alanine-endopeptidase [Saprospiraceae bacterium]
MRNWVGIWVLCCCALAATAQQGLQSTLNDWAKDDWLQHASVGVCVVDATNGQMLAGYGARRSLIPASNLKLLTTATALEILGEDYRFETTLAMDGAVDAQGILQGNVWIIGSGDPTLGSPEMEGVLALDDLIAHWRIRLQQQGIRKITGRVIVDDRIFSTAVSGSHWQWLDMGNYYGCGAFGLNLHENLYYLQFRQRSELGTTPAITGTKPVVPGLQFVNEVTTANSRSGDNAYIYGAPYSYQCYVRGTLPAGAGLFTIKGAVPDPPLLAAQLLTTDLESIGVLCMRPPATARQLEVQPGRLVVLDKLYSPPLRKIVHRTNMESVNLYAEALLRAIGRQVEGVGSEEAGLRAMRAHWENKGMDWAGVQLYDGSGMAPRNVIPTAFLCQLLHQMHRNAAFVESLPLAGRSGSLKNSLKGTMAEGKLRAKSGSLEQVRCYTGYTPDANGRLLAFSILLNNYDGTGADARKKIFHLLSAIAASY